jgi:hypothetical protein
MPQQPKGANAGFVGEGMHWFSDVQTKPSAQSWMLAQWVPHAGESPSQPYGEQSIGASAHCPLLHSDATS